MNNPLSSDPKMALYPHPVNCAGWRVWKMLDDVCEDHVSKALYLEKFERRNVLSSREWSWREASEAGRALMDELSGRTMAVLGVQTARALGLPRLPWCQWGQHSHLPGPTTYCIIPHPSGRCREYNDPTMRERVGLLLTDMLVLGVPSAAVAPEASPRLL